MRYIGAKDKNGNKIEEYDIMRFGNAKGIVKYRKDLARFDVEGIPPSNCWFLIGIEEEWEKGEIIGRYYRVYDKYDEYIIVEAKNEKEAKEKAMKYLFPPFKILKADNNDFERNLFTEVIK